VSRVPGTAFSLVRCQLCGGESKSNPDPTLAKGIVLAYCPDCRRRGPHRDLGPAQVIAPTRAPETLRSCEIAGCASPAESGHPLCTDHRIDDESGMAVVELLDEEDRIQAAYREWRATPDGLAAVTAIRRRALELRRRGWRHYGIQALAEVVRFDRALSVGPDADGYRVNNSHLSRLARDLMDEEPELASFFELRVLRRDR